MAGCMKTSISHQSFYTSLYRNPLIEQKSSNEGAGNGNGVPLVAHIRRNLAAAAAEDKENYSPNVKNVVKTDYDGKKKAGAGNELISKGFPSGKSQLRENLLKPSSLHLCIKKNEPDSVIGFKVWDSVDTERPNSVNVWDYSDSEAAPLSSWSTLPNRYLIQFL